VESEQNEVNGMK